MSKLYTFISVDWHVFYFVYVLFKISLLTRKSCFQKQSSEEESFISESESFEQTVARYDIQFNGMLLTLMDKVAYRGRKDFSDALFNLLYR